MIPKEIVLPRITDAGFENPETPGVQPIVFRTGSEEFTVESNEEEIGAFAKALEESLRRSCDPTFVVIPTLSHDDGQGVLKGEVVKFYFPSETDRYVFLVDTDGYSRVEVRLSRTGDTNSTVRLSRNQRVKIVSH